METSDDISMQSERVLVVDDEPGIREMLKAVLEEMGYQCEMAPEAATAFKMVCDEHFDLLLLDVMMPGCSGAELFQQVMEVQPDIAVVFITARADLDLAVDTMKSGAYDYLIKPVGVDRIVQVVERALSKRKGLQEQVQNQEALEKSAEEQSKMADNYSCQLDALNRMVQSKIMEQTDLEEAAERLAGIARSTAELLNKLADEATTSVGGGPRIAENSREQISPKS